MMRTCVAGAVLMMLLAGTARAEEGEKPPTLAEVTEGFERYDGFLDFFWDEGAGKIWLLVDRFDQELLYVHALPAGVGANDIGLDRGQLGTTRVVRFRRIGPKVLLEQPNYRYRTESDRPSERLAVDEAFATSVLWGFEVAAAEGERVLVDATPFLLRDAHGVSRRLEERNQGSYHLDASRSAVYLPRSKGFPANTELEVSLTFTGSPRGASIRSVAPSPDAVTVRQRHSFIELPDAGYRPRRSDPRAGYGEVSFLDYSAALGEPLRKAYIRRHRLARLDPTAASSPAVEPIVYYVDRAAPEPMRSALLEGARWWEEAFAAAGYEGAFRVELMPEGADPMDVRYNVIQWVHRSTRGWSYGSSVADPRTGEILKGHVTLGSLRTRQDFMIAEGLLAPYTEGGEGAEQLERMVLARLRQLTAHEVGHTLGLAHNFAASSNELASVMDYPHPWIELGAAGEIDLSRAYGVGIGDWDRMAIRYGYEDFPSGADEAAALENILAGAIERGLLYITDRDARDLGGAHPRAHLWDNGADAAGELERILEVRERALERFSQRNVPLGTPLTRLEDVLVPIYLLHRYQTQAAVKVVGGLDYSYAVRGDGQTATARLPAAAQRRALSAVLATLEPARLTLAPELVALIPPRAPGFGRDRENLQGRTGPTFDPVAAAETAADLTLSLLLHRSRASRLVQQHAEDPELPGLEELLDRLRGMTWNRPTPVGLEGLVKRAVDRIYLTSLMRLATAPLASGQAQALAMAELTELDELLAETPGEERAEAAHRLAARRRIWRFFEDPASVIEPSRLEPPAGDPIGADPTSVPTHAAACSGW